jgi:hypothetical protein
MRCLEATHNVSMLVDVLERGIVDYMSCCYSIALVVGSHCSPLLVNLVK